MRRLAFDVPGRCAWVLLSAFVAVTAACAPAASPPTAAPATKPTSASAAAATAPAAAPTAAPAAAPTSAPVTATGAAFDPASVKTLADLNAALKGRSAEERKQILTAGAQKEGAFELYSTMAADSAQALMDAFHKAYPSTNAQVFRTTNGELTNKALAEVRAGKTQFDLIDVSPESVVTYEDAGAVVPYDSPIMSELAQGMHDPQGYWTYMYLNGVVTAWNTNNVKPDEVPNTLDDFLLPRWKGKLSLDTQDAAWANFIKATMGEQKGLDYLKKLSAQSPRMLNGRTNQLSLLTAGEFDLSPALFDYASASAVAKGAPIAWKYIRPTMIQGEALLANKTAPHPYSALLFVDWLYSKDGMQVFHDATGRVMPRADVKLKLPSLADQLKGETWIQGPETGRNLKQQETEFAEIFKTS